MLRCVSVSLSHTLSRASSASSSIHNRQHLFSSAHLCIAPCMCAVAQCVCMSQACVGNRTNIKNVPSVPVCFAVFVGYVRCQMYEPTNSYKTVCASCCVSLSPVLHTQCSHIKRHLLHLHRTTPFLLSSMLRRVCADTYAVRPTSFFFPSLLPLKRTDTSSHTHARARTRKRTVGERFPRQTTSIHFARHHQFERDTGPTY